MDLRTPRILSLCSGVGGLDLGVELAYPGSRAVCYVERELGAAAILASRMEDGALAPAPIWSDLDTLPAVEFYGLVDLVTAGFPCQPWSAAGSKQGAADDRWLWPRIAEIVSDCGAPWVFLENVRGLISGGGLEPVIGDLSDLGYLSAWCCLRAAHVGAPHRRERIFILARRVSDTERDTLRDKPERGPSTPPATDSRDSEPRDLGSQPLGDSDGERYDGSATAYQWREFPPGPDSAEWADVPGHLAPAIEPGFCVLVDGAPVVVDEARAHQLRAAGNGVVPLQAALALRVLMSRLRDRLDRGD